MAISTFLANEILDQVYGAQAYTAPGTVYLALSTANPTADGSGLAEPSGNNYSRLAVTNNLTNFPAASAGAKSNGVAFTFPTPSGSWGTITHVAIFDAASGGNMLDFGALAAAKTIGNGDVVQFAIGELDITRV